MAMAIKTEKQSSKIIKPFVPTPPTLAHYKLGFIDKFAPNVNISVVLYFSTNSNQNTDYFARLEKSLEKTLARFYPLAGRYVEETDTIDCNDQGVEFIHAKVNIKLQDYLVSEENVKYIDEFIPTKIGVVPQQSDSLLAAQVTTFECGGVAIGVRASHKIVDASTLSTLLNEWAVTNREENDIEFTGAIFNSSLLFPARSVCSMQIPPMNDDELKMCTRKKLSFSENFISNMKARGSSNARRRWSKVQIVSSIIWKAFMDVDLAIHNYQRKSILLQPVNLRGKMVPLIPKTSCGNFCGLFATECKTLETIEELTNRLSDSVKESVINFTKEHHDCEEGKMVVLNSLLNVTNISEDTCVYNISSWCNFSFYQVDFGFGKPIWAAPVTVPFNHTAILMEGVEGNGVDAYVFLEVKDIPHFEEALKHAIEFGA